MTNSFDRLVGDARTFYTALAEDNTKAWWQDNKATYEADLKAPALLLMDIVAGELSAETGEPLSTKLFRPHRDVRFSKDKTPYTTHLHMLWSIDQGPGPAYFFGISPTYVRVGAGLMGMSKDTLTAYRDRAATGAFADIVDPLLAQGFTMDEAELKRVPAPFDKEHAQAAWLRRKSLTLWDDLDGAPKDLVGTLIARFKALHPLTRALATL